MTKIKNLQKEKKKKKKKEEEAFLNTLFKTVAVVKQQVVEEGETAKNVLCVNFKAGLCDKGDKCEFSHDLNIEFNVKKYNLFEIYII